MIGSYSVEVRKLGLYLLDLICEGLGLEAGYFGDELSKVQLMAINHYPPCPDPSLTLGLPKHSDVNLITILLHGQVHGLQVLNDGQWLALEPPPYAFVVNVGHMLQVLLVYVPYFPLLILSFFFKVHGVPAFLTTLRKPTNVAYKPIHLLCSSTSLFLS